jgi:hypothetical protein
MSFGLGEFTIKLRNSFGSLLLAVLLFSGCDARQKDAQEQSSVCGKGKASSALNGLFWLMGEPTGANVLCSVQGGEYRSVQVLAPESRDPILLKDISTKQTLLVERFSGSAARSSRATLYAPTADVLMQRGNWPQNVYSVLRVSDSQAIVTGFDFADLRRFNWSNNQSEALIVSEAPLFQPSQLNPILTLRRGEWLATVDSGFDLKRFSAKTVRALVFREAAPETLNEKKLVDSKQNLECQNAFQFLLLSSSSAIVSCNPQYFGAVEGEKVGVFHIELAEQGELVVRALLSRNANEVQKIDLWGLSPSGESVFVGLKRTTVDDYNGTIVQSGWISWRDGAFTSESRFAGPVSALSAGSFVCSCQQDSESCGAGDFLLVDEASVTRTLLRRESTLPFLSFAVDIPPP